MLSKSIWHDPSIEAHGKRGPRPCDAFYDHETIGRVRPPGFDAPPGPPNSWLPRHLALGIWVPELKTLALALGDVVSSGVFMDSFAWCGFDTG
jgi:hypothetical protein